MKKDFSRNIENTTPEIYIYGFIKQLGIFIPVLTGCSYLVSLIKTYFFFHWFSFDILPFLSFTDVLLPNLADIAIVAASMAASFAFVKWLTIRKIERGLRTKKAVWFGISLFLFFVIYFSYVLWTNRNDSIEFRQILGLTIFSVFFILALLAMAILILPFERPGEINLFTLLMFSLQLTFLPMVIGWGKAHDLEVIRPKSSSTYQFKDITVISNDSIFCIGVTSNYIFFFDESDRSTSIYKMSDLVVMRAKKNIFKIDNFRLTISGLTLRCSFSTSVMSLIN